MRRPSNDLTSLLKKQTKAQESAYGKYGAIVHSINDNTKAIKELIEIIKNK